MAGRGSGSINTKLDTFRAAGEHQEYVSKVLSNTLADLQKAKENVAPNRARYRENLLNRVVHQTALATRRLSLRQPSRRHPMHGSQLLTSILQ